MQNVKLFENFGHFRKCPAKTNKKNLQTVFEPSSTIYFFFFEILLFLIDSCVFRFLSRRSCRSSLKKKPKNRKVPAHCTTQKTKLTQLSACYETFLHTQNRYLLDLLILHHCRHQTVVLLHHQLLRLLRLNFLLT